MKANQFKEIKATKRSLNMRKLVFGVGVNDANYHVVTVTNGIKFTCPYYSRWASMLYRCYSEKYLVKKPSYRGCSVCDEWLTFSNFKLWMSKQDWHKKHLDKDLLIQGNKIYSGKSCLFVSPEINTLLVSCNSKRGEYPQGVHFNKTAKRYTSCCMVNGKQKHIGNYGTPEEASDSYIEFKTNLIKSVAEKQDEHVKSALLSYNFKEVK
jgi:hypothetical protein